MPGRPTRCGGCRGSRCSTCRGRSRSAPTSAGGWSTRRSAARCKADGARIESAVTGMVVDRIQASGRFSGSRLVLTGISGSTPGGGSVSGQRGGRFLGRARRRSTSISTPARARLLDRDDIAATVTGPIAIRSSGARRDDQRQSPARQRPLHARPGERGRVGAAAQGAQRRAATRTTVIEVAQLQPWKLDLDVAGGDLTVRGLGIDSRWSDRPRRSAASVDAPRFTGRADLDPRRL